MYVTDLGMQTHTGLGSADLRYAQAAEARLAPGNVKHVLNSTMLIIAGYLNHETVIFTRCANSGKQS